MMRNILSAVLLLAFSLQAKAQYDPPSGDNPYSSSGNTYSDGSDVRPFGSEGFESFIGDKSKMVMAHAVLATLAMALLFPFGGILIRLASFQGLWLAHGLFQICAYFVFTAAFAMGVYMFTHMPSELPNGIRIAHEAHPFVGMVVFGLLFLQPWLGFIHHFAFKKYNKRVFWSYAHLWIGRSVITLGIVNGGLGLQLSKRIGQYAPKSSSIIAYAVTAGVVYLLYVLSAIYGEAKRKRAQYEAVATAPPPYTTGKHGSASNSRNNVQYA